MKYRLLSTCFYMGDRQHVKLVVGPSMAGSVNPMSAAALIGWLVLDLLATSELLCAHALHLPQRTEHRILWP